MPSPTAPKKKPGTRVTSLEMPPNYWQRFLRSLMNTEALKRIGLAWVAAVAIWLIVGGSRPPLGYRLEYAPPRDVVSRIEYKESDPEATAEARRQARRQVRFIYTNDPEPLTQLRAALQRRVVELTSAAVPADAQAEWAEFMPQDPKTPFTADESAAAYKRFRDALATPEAIERFNAALAKAFEPLEHHGLLDKLPQEPNEGDQEVIYVHRVGVPDQRELVNVTDVIIGDDSRFEKRLADVLVTPDIAVPAARWLRSRLPNTLTIDADATRRAQVEAEEGVEQQFKTIPAGDLLAPFGHPLTAERLDQLVKEQRAFVASIPTYQWLARSVLMFCGIVGLFVLCAYFIWRRDHRVIDSMQRLSVLLVFVVLTVAAARWAYFDPWQAELLPLVFFGVTTAIAYRQGIALLLSAAITLVLSFALGMRLDEWVIVMGTLATAILFVSDIRSRSKLIKVGLVAAVFAALTTFGVAVLEEQPFTSALLTSASRNAAWTLAASFLVTGLLPVIEKVFSVLTQISLLELGDVAHPLLQELVRRAPGTYNHSINVASIAEAAAQSIGANGLLVRVGAYFHDIGKILKPGYFVENQVGNVNRHESLMPAMSTLIIIAHIKDGADLARQHHLPRPIVDLIEQHHGTTLVEYFYQLASQQSQSAGAGDKVEESTYRYPGPKPQTKEAGVLMLADAVEGASRTLVEPTPARIESLVESIGMKRLLDGQFDECGLSLRELRTIQDSVIKSLTAIYHARVKYPEPQTA
ncbi:MAG: HDIG domain-containing protein [Pirellulales bacterium]